ncbi:hypothetical protein L1987_60208 [Smallanthus sonchifolius]|uniref:Uncharacterized protein n=1 Tax=Smallanthus sonchifolius TaxID=185202 RepID=A0ACB9D7E2_9ASTR|nr:hypothetical protein L1987_60208 [Smallanthus sonchifolius]
MEAQPSRKRPLSDNGDGGDLDEFNKKPPTKKPSASLRCTVSESKSFITKPRCPGFETEVAQRTWWRNHPVILVIVIVCSSEFNLVFKLIQLFEHS